MAAASERENAGLSRQLLREPHRFDFFQAVRLLERQAYAQADGTGEPVGRDAAPDREVVRIRAAASLSFPPAPVLELRPARGSGPLEMVVAFLGLTGPCGVLPYHYTALLLRRLRNKDASLDDFLDLFNHRFASLFYRAWQKYRLPFAYEQARLDGGDADPCTLGLYCLVGLGTGGLRGRLRIDDEAFLFYGGHFAHHPRSAVALEALLQDYFEMPIEVQQLHGQWLCLERGERTALPAAGARLGSHTELGVDVIVGERVWDVQSMFRLRVGPLTYRQFRLLMPGGDGLRPLCELTRSYAGPELSFDVQPVLRADEVPRCRLGSAEDDPPQLGWNTWIASEAFTADAVDPVFSVEEI
jgi:type VI secretion system protein ImpH